MFVILIDKEGNKFYFKISSKLVLYWPSDLIDMDDGTNLKTSSSFLHHGILSYALIQALLYLLDPH